MSKAGFLAIILIFSSLITVVLAQNQVNNPRPRRRGHHAGRNRHSSGATNINGVPSMDEQFVNAHNAVRSNFNETPLAWDQTVANYAKQWANQRVDDCLLEHSPDSPYGENMFWSQNEHWTPSDIVKAWADEFKYYDPNTNECINDTVCGHYTQIVWKSTQRLGCGRIACNGNKGFLYVCSYDPPGNYYFEGPFGGHFDKSIVNPPSSSTSSISTSLFATGTSHAPAT